MYNIVSLIPSGTEIICALGFENGLVGRSHECDCPESVKRLPVCTEPKFDTSGSSSEIDKLVKGLLHEALSVYNVDSEALMRLEPDLIVTQAQCEVCAVSLREVEQAVCGWVGSRPRIISLEPKALSDVWGDIGHVADALGVSERGAEVVERLKRRVDDISEKARAVPERPTVACIEWIDPLMAAGNWMPQMVDMAGGVNLFGSAGQHSPWMTWEALREKDPDVIVALPCGFDIERSRKETPALTQRSDWSQLKAVQNRRVYLTDGNHYFNRPGPRLVESLEILAEVLHPGRFHFGHEGMDWEYL